MHKGKYYLTEFRARPYVNWFDCGPLWPAKEYVCRVEGWTTAPGFPTAPLHQFNLKWDDPLRDNETGWYSGHNGPGPLVNLVIRLGVNTWQHNTSFRRVEVYWLGVRQCSNPFWHTNPQGVWRHVAENFIAPDPGAVVVPIVDATHQMTFDAVEY